MEFTTSTYQKIGVVYGILVILVLAALGVRYFQGKNLQKALKPPTAKTSVEAPKPKVAYVGKLSLSAPLGGVKVGETIEVMIYFEAPGKILDGADVVLRYDPQVLTALGFTEGDYFKLVPRKDVDNEAGVVKVTAVDPVADTVLGAEKVVLGKVVFQAQTAGTTQISFDFVAGGTAKTTLTEKGTSQNILGEASGITIRVTP